MSEQLHRSNCLELWIFYHPGTRYPEGSPVSSADFHIWSNVAINAM